MLHVNRRGAGASPGRAGAAGTNANIVVDNPTYVTIPLELGVAGPRPRCGSASASIATSPNGCRLPPAARSCLAPTVKLARAVGRQRSPRRQDRVLLHLHADSPGGRPYNLYHGTLEVRPLTDKTSKMYYTLMYDNSMMADDAAREKDKASRTPPSCAQCRT